MAGFDFAQPPGAPFPERSRRALWLFLFMMLVSSLPAFAASRADARNDEKLRNFLQQTINQASSFKDRFDAEVWLVSMNGKMDAFKNLDNADRLRILKSVHQEATQANLKPELVLAVIEVESRFDHFAISRVGAQGLMQVMPFWKDEIGRPADNLTAIETNIRYGCRILQYYLQREKGNVRYALARYNGSYGENWYAERVMNAWRDRWYSGMLEPSLQ